MAKVEIVAERCKSCGYCVKFCPKHVLEIGTKVNSKGYEYVTPARPEDCIGCGICAQKCPRKLITVDGKVPEVKPAAPKAAPAAAKPAAPAAEAPKAEPAAKAEGTSETKE